MSVASFSQEIAPVKQVTWGNHKEKPTQQTNWEKVVENEVNNIIWENTQDYFPYMTHVPQPEVAELNEGQTDCRPRLFDPTSKQWMLMDTCAQVSVWPRGDYADATISQQIALQAVNGTKIPTFGIRTREVKLGRKAYSKQFILADIQTPIIGWDFIKANKVSMIWNSEGGLDLVDKLAKISVLRFFF